MPYDPFKHHRRSIRLPGYDYSSSGGYFVTIDTHDRMHIFGEIAGGEMHLNEWGAITDACWRATPRHFPNAELDAFIVMPDHMHGINTISENTNGIMRNSTTDKFAAGTVGAR
jgi:putative transposase